MSHLNTISIVMLATFFCRAAGGGDQRPTTAPSQAFGMFLNVEDGYSIKYPATWKGGNAIAETGAILFASTEEVGNEHLKPHFTIRIFATKLTEDINEIAKGTDALVASMPNFKLVEKSAIDLSGHHGFKFVFEGRPVDKRITSVVASVIIDGKNYVISYRTSPDAYISSKPTIQTILGSFRVVEKHK